MISDSPMSRTTAPSEIVHALRPFIDRRELAGLVTLVVTKNKTLMLDALGFADLDAKKPMQSDALFWVASMSKPVAATAVLMLADEGKLGLDVPAEAYLPQFKPKIIALGADGNHAHLGAPQHPITIRHLLSHTSGLPASSSVDFPTLDSLSLATSLEVRALEVLRFEPGTDFLYSNPGISIIANIVEAVTGLRYADYLQEKLFGPLGMTDTTFFPSRCQVARLAKAYRCVRAGADLQPIPIRMLRMPLTEVANRHVFPGGGLFSTAGDFGKFCQMLLNGGALNGTQYLSMTATYEMSRNQLSDAVLQKVFSTPPFNTGTEGDPDGHGLGFFTFPSGVFGHPGAYYTNIRINPKRGIATVWMTQYGNYADETVRNSQTAFDVAAAAYNDAVDE
jgi:CubicO group peptidase (beta-lactamase class C family)